MVAGNDNFQRTVRAILDVEHSPGFAGQFSYSHTIAGNPEQYSVILTGSLVPTLGSGGGIGPHALPEDRWKRVEIPFWGMYPLLIFEDERMTWGFITMDSTSALSKMGMV